MYADGPVRSFSRDTWWWTSTIHVHPSSVRHHAASHRALRLPGWRKDHRHASAPVTLEEIHGLRICPTPFFGIRLGDKTTASKEAALPTLARLSGARLTCCQIAALADVSAGTSNTGGCGEDSVKVTNRKITSVGRVSGADAQASAVIIVAAYENSVAARNGASLCWHDMF